MVTSSHGNRQHSRRSHPWAVFLKDPLSVLLLPVLRVVPCGQGPLGRGIRLLEGRGQERQLREQLHHGPSGTTCHLHSLYPAFPPLTAALYRAEEKPIELPLGLARSSQGREADDVTDTQGSPMRGRARLCPASSAPPRTHAGPTPDHQQPGLSHFLSSDISPAAAFVAMSFHQGKLTIPNP